MIELPISVAIIMTGLFMMLKEHNKANDHKKIYNELNQRLEESLKEFEDYKKKVNTLILKANFKV